MGRTASSTDRTKAVAYLRVSTEKQADGGVSLASQRAKVEAYAALYDLDLVTVGLSLRKVGAALADRGLLPRSGRQWHAQTVKALLGARLAA